MEEVMSDVIELKKLVKSLQQASSDKVCNVHHRLPIPIPFILSFCLCYFFLFCSPCGIDVLGIRWVG